MEGAELFVLPSLYEGFGIPVLEAMSMKVPVVCSDIPPLREVAADAAIYFDPESPEDMAEKMHQAMDESKKKELVESGSKRVQQFSWESTGEQTWSLLKSMLSA